MTGTKSAGVPAAQAGGGSVVRSFGLSAVRWSRPVTASVVPAAECTGRDRGRRVTLSPTRGRVPPLPAGEGRGEGPATGTLSCSPVSNEEHVGKDQRPTGEGGEAQPTQPSGARAKRWCEAATTHCVRRDRSASVFNAKPTNSVQSQISNL